MIIVSGLLNIETNVKVKGFPIPYFPIDYPFFKINSNVSGVGMNIGKAMKALGEEVNLLSYVATDEEGERVIKAVEKEGIASSYIEKDLRATPSSVVLYDEEGKRQVYCDLKDVQDQTYPVEKVSEILKESDAVILCNINFNRELLKAAKKMKKLIATDVHVIHDAYDGFNKPFMMSSKILFLSDENLPCAPEEFLMKLEKLYHNKIIVLGQGEKGAMMYVKAENKIYDIGSVQVREIVNTVGAGDALFTAFVHYYVKGLSPIEALKRAEVFAAYKIGVSGAANGFASEEMIEELLQKVVFEEKIIEME